MGVRTRVFHVTLHSPSPCFCFAAPGVDNVLVFAHEHEASVGCCAQGRERQKDVCVNTALLGAGPNCARPRLDMEKWHFLHQCLKQSFKQKQGQGRGPLLQRGSLLLPVAPLGLRPQLPAGCSHPSLRAARGD